MKISRVMIFAAAFLVSGAIAADEVTTANEPIELSAAQMDQITAGDLTTPGNKVFSGFDNPAPGDFHPTLMMGVGKEGPWHAHFNSHMINCEDC